MIWAVVCLCCLMGFVCAVLYIGNMMGQICLGEDKHFENGRLCERSKIAGYCIDLADDLQAAFESFDANTKKIIAENIQLLHSLAGDLRKYSTVDEMYTFDPRILNVGLDHEDGWGNPVGSDPFAIRLDPPHKPVWTELPDEYDDSDWDGAWGSHPSHADAVEDVEKQIKRDLRMGGEDGR